MFDALPCLSMDLLQLTPFFGVQLSGLEFPNFGGGDFLQFGGARLSRDSADLSTSRFTALLLFKFVDLSFDFLPTPRESFAQFLGNSLDFKPLDLASFPYLPDFIAECLYLAGQLVLIDLPGVPHRLQHPVFMEGEPSA